MSYKLKGALKNSKTLLIIIPILWIILSKAFVAPWAVAKVESTTDGKYDITKHIEIFVTNVTNVSENLSKIFQSQYIRTFWRTNGYFTIALIFFALVGFVKSMPKNEFSEIEHGSSDWAAGGEEYKVLSNKKGIILAEKHYLPVDKRGNVNVLVVGRFRFW